ncbi:transcription factor bHLH123 isoform X2 [Rhododendron vialii]|uniref:transcription factor bHLH123 isoform X2 n=1 Tax=Rhododendron vialii TaxID=182163 RepID=UPI0026601A29|nr:transcription factor bHLH123 isoform X2 [Rhododendron vialii]
MADEFPIGGGNWWESSRNRFESGSSASSSAPLTSNLLVDPNLQMMDLSLSSQAMDWNQPLLRGGKAETSFRSAIQEDLNTSASFRSEIGMESPANEYKQINRGFLLDQPQLMDQAAYGSPSTLLQGLLSTDHNQQQVQQQSGFDNQPMNYPYPASYGMSSGEVLLPNSWSKFPNFLRPNSPPKQHQAPPSQLQFSNSGQFWNASTTDVRSSFFPSLQSQFPPPSFDEKPKSCTSEVKECSTVGKKSSGSEASSKRSRSEAPAPLPPFKVRKEKMGDKITALQQLVSPFGKTDTASVLSEAIEYIKFLHEQVNVLSTPYMKSGASMQLQQNPGKSKEDEGPKQDLRSRGLCLVPVSSTYPVTHETTVDFWTPTFGGTYR